jgi:hypothetical protein
MRVLVVICGFLLWCSSAPRKDKPASGNSVTVPATIDHNRVVLEAEVAASNGKAERVRAWLDNENPELNVSRRLATALGLQVSCDEKECSAAPPASIAIGGLNIPLTDVKEARIPLKPVSAAAVLAAGMNVEINLPSRVLRHYDVLVDFPEHKFTIGTPGSIHFQGQSGKALINPENGLVQIPSQIERKKYNLALDLGACISFLSGQLFDPLAAAHQDWPHMSGAVGSANMWGMDEEPNWKVMRLDRLQYGPLFLTNVAVVHFPKDRMEWFEKRAGVATAGLIGSQALLNYRVGIDYARSLVYFDIGRTFTFPDFDVIGLVLRPEDDGRYTILGVADFDGKPSVMPAAANGVAPGDHLIAVNNVTVRGATMGQVWSLLRGTPGQQRILTIERAGKQFLVGAEVRHFLGENPESDAKKEK